MPKTRFDSFKKNAPPIDWLHAAILERKLAYGYDLKKMAVVASVSYDYMRRLITLPPNRWPYGALTKVCEEFGIKMVPSVNGSTPEEEFK